MSYCWFFLSPSSAVYVVVVVVATAFLNIKLHIEYCFWLQLNFGYFYWLSEFFLLIIHFSLNFSISISKITEKREWSMISSGFIPRYISFNLSHSHSLLLLFPQVSHFTHHRLCVCVCVSQFEFFSLSHPTHLAISSLKKCVCLIVIIFSIYLASYSGKMSINGYYGKLFEQHGTLWMYTVVCCGCVFVWVK